jgi:release factor glutamine methyltransferase
MSSPYALKRNAFPPGITTTTSNLGTWLGRARALLIAAGARGEESSVLAAHVLAKDRSWILAHPEIELSGQQLTCLDSLVERLAAGEPLPYLIGIQEFYDLTFQVSNQVLIPRPETELLVEHAINWLKKHPERRCAVDIGTGSGCIAITLAVHIPDLRIVASDLSSSALEIARVNAKAHEVCPRIELVQGDLFASVSGKFHMVCANLPYIPSKDVKRLPVSCFEPRLALDGGPDGLVVIQHFLDQVEAHLHPGGLVLLEIEYRQGSNVKHMAQSRFPRAIIEVHPDLAGHDRLVRIEMPDEN